MKIRISIELKNNEYRIGMTPAGVQSLISYGHTVYIQSSAGLGSGYTDNDYILVGAAILSSIEEIYKAAVEDGILDLAQQNAEHFLEKFFGALGYENVIFLDA